MEEPAPTYSIDFSHLTVSAQEEAADERWSSQRSSCITACDCGAVALLLESHSTCSPDGSATPQPGSPNPKKGQWRGRGGGAGQAAEYQMSGSSGWDWD